MAVREKAEQAKIDVLDRLPTRTTRLIGRRGGEHVLEVVDVLQGDPVAARRGRHGLAESDGRRLGDVMLVGASEPARIGGRDRPVGGFGVLHGQSLQNPGERRPQGLSRTALERSMREGGAEQHDAQIGVAADRRERGPDGAFDPLADGAAGDQTHRGHFGRAFEGRGGHAVTFAEIVDVAGLQRCEFGAAGVPKGGRDRRHVPA